MKDNIEHKFNEGECVTVFNLNIESEEFNSFVRHNIILKTIHYAMFVTVYYKPNVNSK